MIPIDAIMIPIDAIMIPINAIMIPIDAIVDKFEHLHMFMLLWRWCILQIQKSHLFITSLHNRTITSQCYNNHNNKLWEILKVLENNFTNKKYNCIAQDFQQ